MTPAETIRGRNHEKLRDELEVLLEVLIDPLVEDVWVNPDGSAWVNRRGIGSERLEIIYYPEQIRNVINSVAAINQTVVNASFPVIEAVLPFGGERFEGIVPPMSDAPMFAIRPRPRSVYTLDDYVELEVLSSFHARCLKAFLAERQNILIVGGTGAGKTTLLNASLRYIAEHCPQDRIVTIEDTLEIQCESVNRVSLHAIIGFPMARCLVSALRLRPTRIIVGEVRGPEALDLLKAWNTGHPGGLSTVHANNARAGLLRLEALAREATEAPQQHFIAQAINYIAFLAEDRSAPAGRRLRELVHVTGYRDGEYQLEVL